MSDTHNAQFAAPKARHLAMHTPATAGVEEYAAWLEGELSAKRVARKIDAAKLRRAVIAKRNGCSLAEISDAIGMAKVRVSMWLAKLPPELRA